MRYTRKVFVTLAMVALEAVSGNRIQVKTPLTYGPNSALGAFSELLVDTILLDVPSLLTPVPGKKFAKPLNMTHASPQEMVDHLKYAMASVCLPEQVMGFQCFCNNVLSDVRVVEARPFGSLAIVGLDKKEKLIVISYRHTLSTHSKEINMQYQMTYMPNAPRDVGVHYGMLGYQLSLQGSLEDVVSEFLKDPEYKDFKILITGYSSGAAVSVISVPDWSRFLKRENQQDRAIEVQAYSGSRVGNEAFANYVRSLNIPITRYTRLNDMVPRMPPRGLNFTHVGVEIHERQIGNVSSLVVCSQEYDEDPGCIIGEPVPLNPAVHFFPFGKVIARDLYCTF